MKRFSRLLSAAIVVEIIDAACVSMLNLQLEMRDQAIQRSIRRKLKLLYICNTS